MYFYVQVLALYALDRPPYHKELEPYAGPYRSLEAATAAAFRRMARHQWAGNAVHILESGRATAREAKQHRVLFRTTYVFNNGVWNEKRR